MSMPLLITVDTENNNNSSSNNNDDNSNNNNSCCNDNKISRNNINLDSLFCSPQAGYHKRCGTTFLGSEPEEKDCNLIARLRELGAIIMGMTNMYELGLGTIGDNPNK